LSRVKVGGKRGKKTGGVESKVLVNTMTATKSKMNLE